MKVLVTGATGFLGAWAVRRLLEDGIQVRIIKRRSSSLEDVAGLDIEQVEGDVTDVESLVRACHGVDSVFHLAGLIAYSHAEREAMERVNVTGTANMIEACKRVGVRRMLHLSSVVAVGASFDGKKPLDENSPFTVGHLGLGYFNTKRRAEELVIDAVRRGEVDAVMINPSTIYGPGDAKKGSRKVQLKVARGEFPFYPPGGVNVVAVEDVIECMMAAWRVGKAGERYIVAGENLLLKELFEIIASEAGVHPPKLALPKPVLQIMGRAGDVFERFGKKGPITSENAWMSTLYHWFDNSKAKRELGLQPKTARHAISRSVTWMREHGLLD